MALADLDFARLGSDGALAEGLQGFSWLRDLAATGSRGSAAGGVTGAAGTPGTPPNPR